MERKKRGNFSEEYHVLGTNHYIDLIPIKEENQLVTKIHYMRGSVMSVANIKLTLVPP